jgi:hypothetical protein
MKMLLKEGREGGKEGERKRGRKEGRKEGSQFLVSFVHFMNILAQDILKQYLVCAQQTCLISSSNHSMNKNTGQS